MRPKVTNSDVDHVLKVLLRNSECKAEGEAPDSVFLAGYREKLRNARVRIESGPLPIGEWGWHAAPVLLLILVFLAVSFWSLNVNMQNQLDSSEGLIWTVVEEGEPDLTPDQIVEIAVVRHSGR
jgi:hypothetical protein